MAGHFFGCIRGYSNNKDLFFGWFIDFIEKFIYLFDSDELRWRTLCKTNLTQNQGGYGGPQGGPGYYNDPYKGGGGGYQPGYNQYGNQGYGSQQQPQQQDAGCCATCCACLGAVCCVCCLLDCCLWYAHIFTLFILRYQSK